MAFLNFSTRTLGAALCAACLFTALPALAEDEEDAPEAGMIEAQEAESAAIAKDLSPQIKPMYEVGEEGDRGRGIRVQAWVDRRNLTYYIGDTLTVCMRTNQDAYITIMNIGSSGSVAVIYPNYYQREARVRGGTTVCIPSRRAKWVIEVGGPVGTDLIKVIATRRPITLKGLQNIGVTSEKSPIMSLDRSAEQTAKDLSPQLKPNEGGEHEYGVRTIPLRILRRR